MMMMMITYFQVEVFWIVTPCSVVVGYQHFKCPYCLDPNLHRHESLEASNNVLYLNYPSMINVFWDIMYSSV